MPLNPLRLDPTRTITLRRRFEGRISRQFARLKGQIILLVEQEDAFGLKPENQLTANVRWRFRTAVDKVREFKAWLREKVYQHVLSDEQSWRQYIVDGFRKGMGRAFGDVKARRFGPKEGDFYQGSKEQFLQDSFGHPVAAEKLELLVSRTLEDLAGVTDAMATTMTRTLADGLVQGKGPREVARDLVKDVEGIGKKRALVIARTECLTGDTLVDTAVVRAIFRRWYVGPLVEVETRCGRKFSATPNHPMLTQNGWVAAGLLRQGDNLICHNRKQGSGVPRDVDVNHGPTMIGEMFNSLDAVGVREREVCRKPDFHGDGMEGDVDVLRPYRELFFGRFAPLYKPLVENVFTPAGNDASRFCAECGGLLPINPRHHLCLATNRYSAGFQTPLDEGAINPHVRGDRHQRFAGRVAANDGVNVDVIPVLVGGPTAIPRKQLPLADSPADALLPENFSDLLLLRADGPCDLSLREAREIELDDVLSVRIRPFAGHVYNLETPYGYYTIDGAYTGNTIRAHSEGQLVALEDLGVGEVSVAVEWTTTKDGKTCPLCLPLQGIVLTLAEAHGMLPRHPNCRCAWIPSLGTAEEAKTQKRSRTSIEKAIRQSVSREGGEKKSKWVGADKSISPDRPESILDNVSAELLAFSRALQGFEGLPRG